MKLLFTLILFFSFTASCANVPKVVLQFQKREYRLCEDAEAKYWKGASSAVGLVCWRYCKRWKLWRKQTHENCKVWGTDILDLRQEKDYLKFRNAGFILINQAEIE